MLHYEFIVDDLTTSTKPWHRFLARPLTGHLAGASAVEKRKFMLRESLLSVCIAMLACAQAPLRTADGQPDLQGIWSNATITPLERPADLAGKQTFTAEEAAAYEKQAVDRNNADRRGTDTEADVAGGYNNFWFDRGSKAVGTRRTSLIVDPPDGRIPALLPEADKRAKQ